MRILKTLQEAEKEFGDAMVRVELERIALERNAPHVADACLDCRIDACGEWVFCSDSRHHPDHPYHSCPMTQDCDCEAE
jgi:hypothetical protein